MNGLSEKLDLFLVRLAVPRYELRYTDVTLIFEILDELNETYKGADTTLRRKALMAVRFVRWADCNKVGLNWFVRMNETAYALAEEQDWLFV